MELVIFPEMTLTAFSLNTGETAEEFLKSTNVELHITLAHEFQIEIVFGVVFRDAEMATNNGLLVDNTGTVKANYRKIHPFTFSVENMVFNGDDEICAVKLDSLTIGLTVCYDLRSPEIYSALCK